MTLISKIEHYQLYINGQWVDPISGEYFNVISPATGEVVSRAASGDERDAELAIEASSRAFPKWAAKPAAERAEILRRLSQLILDNRQELAETISREMGRPIQQSMAEVNGSAQYVLWNAEEARRVYGEIIPAAVSNKRLQVIRQPVGPVAAITPWNFPLSMVVRKISPALAAGCSIVLKPAGMTPGSAVQFCKLAAQAGVPDGVINMVTGNAAKIGNALVSDKRIRKITFTGSTEVGKQLLKQAADQVKRVSMELGGHAPVIVFEDADLDHAVATISRGKFQNNGQTCICPNRIYVQQSIKDQFVSLFKEQVTRLKVGNSFDQNADLGPIINKAGLEKVQSHVADALSKGATLVTGGSRLVVDGYQDGNYYLPTVLCDVNESMLIADDETFGPVAPIFTFESEEEVVKKANDTIYGLAAYIFTRDLSRSARVSEALEYGMVGINDTGLAQPEGPFGGVKQSGMGREGGPGGLNDFLETKFISTQI